MTTVPASYLGEELGSTMIVKACSALICIPYEVSI